MKVYAPMWFSIKIEPSILRGAQHFFLNNTDFAIFARQSAIVDATTQEMDFLVTQRLFYCSCSQTTLKLFVNWLYIELSKLDRSVCQTMFGNL